MISARVALLLIAGALLLFALFLGHKNQNEAAIGVSATAAAIGAFMFLTDPT